MWFVLVCVYGVFRVCVWCVCCDVFLRDVCVVSFVCLLCSLCDVCACGVFVFGV